MTAAMKHRSLLWGCVAIAMVAAGGCSKSPEDRIYDAYKCGKAATLLERDADAKQAAVKVEAEFTELAKTVNPSAYMMELASKFQEDVPLHRYSAGDQLRLLESIYKSKTCQALYEATMLDMSGAPAAPLGDNGAGNAANKPPVDTGLVADALGFPAEGTQQEAPSEAQAVLSVARTLAQDRSMGPGAIAQFCETHARSFADAAGVRQCKALGGAQDVPVPKTREDVFRMAAAMTDVRQRYAFCTSDNVSALMTSLGDDYLRCFPKSAQEEAARIGGVVDETETPVRTDAASLRDRVLTHASRMSQPERELYCRVPGVAEVMQNELSECLAGLSPGNPSTPPLTDADPGYSDEGH